VIRAVLSRHARADLDGIWRYTVRQWDRGQAVRYTRAIQAAIDVIAAEPQRGRPCDEIAPGYRRYRTGSHLLFYRVAGNEVRVIRILHESMDLERHL